MQPELALDAKKLNGGYTTQSALDMLPPFHMDVGVGGVDSRPRVFVVRLTNPGQCRLSQLHATFACIIAEDDALHMRLKYKASRAQCVTVSTAAASYCCWCNAGTSSAHLFFVAPFSPPSPSPPCHAAHPPSQSAPLLPARPPPTPCFISFTLFFASPSSKTGNPSKQMQHEQAWLYLAGSLPVEWDLQRVGDMGVGVEPENWVEPSRPRCEREKLHDFIVQEGLLQLQPPVGSLAPGQSTTWTITYKYALFIHWVSHA